MTLKIIQDRLDGYDALIARDAANGYDTPSVDRLAREQRAEAANEAAHISQAFSEAGIFMQMYSTATGTQLEVYLEHCGFSESVIRYVMDAFNAYKKHLEAV